MIRLIILILFLILLWLLLASGFERRRKIILSLLLIGVVVGAFLLDGYDKRELTNLVAESQVQSCGVTAKHSYLTNYDLQLCVQNLSEKGSLSRLQMAIVAKKCVRKDEPECLELDRVIRDIPVKIPPKSERQLLQNLSFENVDKNDEGVQWSLEILSSKATRS